MNRDQETAKPQLPLISYLNDDDKYVNGNVNNDDENDDHLLI